MSTETRFQQVSIKRLFGKWDYDIHIEDRFLIIHGKNGIGKTKVLEIIKATSELILDQLVYLPFEEVSIKYSDDLCLTVVRQENDLMKTADGLELRPLKIKLSKPGKDPLKTSSNMHERVYSVAETGHWRHIDGSLWEDVRDGEIREFERITEGPLTRRRPYSKRLEKLLEEEGIISLELRSSFDDPRILQNIKDELKDREVYIIKTQRLHYIDASRSRPVKFSPRNSSLSQMEIVQQSHTIRDRILEAQKQSSNLTQELDRKFPGRILDIQVRVNAGNNEEVLRKKIAEQNTKRNQLAEVMSVKEDISVLDSDVLKSGTEWEPWQRNVISLYLEDTEKKLAVFDSILDRITLLGELLKDKLFDKKIKITEEEGIEIWDQSIENRKIPLTSLSSGEQHEIILYTDLLFNVKENSLVLIDEPEISLHVAWQEKFVKDVKHIADLANFNFIIATHSPDIVSGYRKHMIRLDGPKGTVR
ncbi:AAA family ATPase [Rothia sp. P7208]|uniref:AAA family ATPase n=1 Tax=Rothia sp. P7208 TaxID=3402660 RepID=UPI003AC79961